MTNIVVRAPDLSTAAVEAFRADVSLATAAYDGLRERLGLPQSEVTAILAGDFASEVESHLPAAMRPEEGGIFTTAREGGVVVAKNLDQRGDASEIIIVFDASFWAHADQPDIRLSLVHVVAHELAHPVIERARYVSGAMDQVILPSITGTEVARSMARIMAGEYRADRLAELVLGSVVTIGADGETKPARTWYSTGARLLDNLVIVLGAAHPRWPDVVQAYREAEIPLEQMWGTVVSSIDQTLTAVVHTQAAVDAVPEELDVLQHPLVAELPAVRLYLAEPWMTFLAALRETPLLAPLAEVAEFEESVVSAGSGAIFEIWHRLGLTIEDRPGRQWSLWVNEPLR